MTDLLFVLITLAFFAVATLVGRWCERMAAADPAATGGDRR